MNAIRPKGWCPTLFAPMPSGDGLLVRIRPPGGLLGGAAARALAAAATRHGNGVIELTSRAGIQVRGLRADTVAPFAAEMVAAGLAEPDPEAERRRILLAPPLAGDDPSASGDAVAVVRAVEEMLLAETRLAALPGKFGVLVDAGGVLPTRAAAADIKVVLSDGALLLLDGSDLAAGCALADVADAVARLSFAFLACRGEHRRMRALVADAGAKAVFAAAGFVARATVAPTMAPTALGWLSYPGTGRGAFGVGLPFGATDGPTLAALADLAEQHGDGTLRATSWRAFAIPGVTAPNVLRTAVETLGLIAMPDDPRAKIFACPGAPFCAGASVPTRADAARLAALGIGGSVHVSGCAKGCAHPDAADLTLVGEAGRYAIVRHGRAGDPPIHTGLTIAALLETLRGVPA